MKSDLENKIKEIFRTNKYNCTEHFSYYYDNNNLRINIISTWSNFSFITYEKLAQLSKLLNTTQINIGEIDADRCCSTCDLSEYEINIHVMNYSYTD